MFGIYIKRILAASLLLLLIQGAGAQEKYWVIFKDKKNTDFDPFDYFDSRAIKKRELLGLPLIQFTDLPVDNDYCDQIENYSEISFISRWLNGVAVCLTREQASSIRELGFVKEVSKMIMTSQFSEYEYFLPDTSKIDHIRRQTMVMGGDHFRKNGIDGKGVRIAVFDGGFTSADTLEIFRHLFDNNQVIATWDFVKKDSFVYDYNSHGTSVLSCIAGYQDGERFGLATGAEFLLARTEVNSEIFAEEEYWAAAMEWADKNGADIINSSLGYTYHRYFPNQMDGKSVFVSRMANMAASKGMLVVNAAGNDGDSDWQVISAPADADSVLTVGGISSSKGIHIAFSSYGPTYDGRMKPNVVAFGDVIASGKKHIKKSYGTSFSAPLVSGFAACVMQIHPEWENMRVLREIEKSGHLYPYYDYAHGFGVPQASYFLGEGKSYQPSFRFEKKINVLNIEIEKVDPEDGSTKDLFGVGDNYLYYHIASKETGKIRKYRVIKMDEADSYNISLDEIRDGEYVMAYYGGYSEKISF